MNSGGVLGIDFAFLDSRSLNAQLHGYGDGRGERYDRFYERMIRLYPTMPLETLNRIYHLKCQRIERMILRMQNVLRHPAIAYLRYASTFLLGIYCGFVISSV